MAFAMLLPCVAFTGIEDAVLRFSTPGPDCYADGSVVADGECYALVWSPAGKAFSGFNADGTAASAADRVVLAAPLAQNGKCRNAIFQIPAAEYAELEGGEWAVCLVDTRDMYGVPVGAQDGKPLRVNRWGLVRSGVKAEAASKVGLAGALQESAARVRSAASSGGGARAGELSAIPPDMTPPRITALEVGGGEVWLAVSNTVPYLSYTIISGKEPGSLKTDYFSEVVDGDAGAEIAIGTLESVNRRFFRVKRAE